MEKPPLHAEDEERITKLATEIKRDEFFFTFALVWLAVWVVIWSTRSLRDPAR